MEENKPISKKEFHQVTDQLLNMILEVQQTQKIILNKLLLHERNTRVTHRQLHDTKLSVKRGYDLCLEQLKAVQKSYHNVLEAQEHCMEENEDLLSDLSNSVTNLGTFKV